MGEGDARSFLRPTEIAILPMGFCFTDTGRSDDLPPRPDCAPAWRDQLLDHCAILKLRCIRRIPRNTFHTTGGYCTYGVPVGKKFDGNPRYAAVVDEKLYVFLKTFRGRIRKTKRHDH